MSLNKLVDPNIGSGAITLDLFVKIARITILNPLFSMWVPLLTLSQRYPTSSPEFYYSSIYTSITFLLVLISWSSTLWTNKPWRTTNSLVHIFGGPAIDWSGQIVVVTGGASGIGKVLVETLTMMRVTVVVIDRDEFKGDSDDVHYYQCDLADASQIEEVARTIKNQVGNPTMLVNNAGVVKGKLMVDLTRDDITSTFNVNVLAHFSLIKEFLPAMIKNGRGHIVTVSSIFGLVAAAQLADYVASKHAVIGLHEALKCELKSRYGDPAVRASLCVLSQVRTPLFASIAPMSSTAAFIAPIVEPHEVAKAIIAALETDQSREIFLPYVGGWLWALRGLPSWAKDFTSWLSGANDSMRTFQAPRSDEKKDL